MSAGEIDLWHFRLDGPAPRRDPLSLLDGAERARYRQFRSAEAARLFALRRAARRAILGDYLAEDPGRLVFEDGPSGRPVLAAPEAGLHFSASDAGAFCVLAVARDSCVGADIEPIRRLNTARLTERVLSPGERMALAGEPPTSRSRLVLRAWTGKEALVKGLGLGLDLAAFRQITLALDAETGTWQPALLGAELARHGPWHVWTTTLKQAGDVMLSVASPVPARVRIIDAASLLSRRGLA